MSTYVMTASDFHEKLKLALDSKTLYVMGCFGAPMTPKNKERYSNNYAYNKQASRTKKIKAATPDTFGFDCVNLVKGVLYGWNADISKVYGGAVYKSNDVPDIGTDSIIKQCRDVSTDFSKLQNGELLWKKGHVGVVYDAANGLAIECTPSWKDGVQITAIAGADWHTGEALKYHSRQWTSHGKLPWIDYTEEEEDDGYVWKVQVGSYKSEANARAKLNQLLSDGYTGAFVRKEKLE